jgi:hypothetical protein
MAFAFKTHQDLYELIQKINKKYYIPSCENIIYLEEICDENAIAYVISLRDSYSHLIKIYEVNDINTHDNKAKIERQLERYSSHLERLLFDTYQKIISIKSNELWNQLPVRDKPAIKSQIALEVKNQRIVADEATTDEKIEGYKKIIDLIEEIFKKFI